MGKVFNLTVKPNSLCRINSMLIYSQGAVEFSTWLMCLLMLIIFAFPKFHGYIKAYHTKDEAKTNLNRQQGNNDKEVNFQDSIYTVVHANHCPVHYLFTAEGPPLAYSAPRKYVIKTTIFNNIRIVNLQSIISRHTEDQSY